MIESILIGVALAMLWMIDTGLRRILVTAKEALATLKETERLLGELAGCVRKNHNTYGDKCSLSTKHWNE